MGDYKIYNRLYYKGKPTGRIYVSNYVKANSSAEARAKGERLNKDWVRRTKSKKYMPKVVKVVRLTQKESMSNARKVAKWKKEMKEYKSKKVKPKRQKVTPKRKTNIFGGNSFF